MEQEVMVNNVIAHLAVLKKNVAVEANNLSSLLVDVENVTQQLARLKIEQEDATIALRKTKEQEDVSVKRILAERKDIESHTKKLERDKDEHITFVRNSESKLRDLAAYHGQLGDQIQGLLKKVSDIREELSDLHEIEVHKKTLLSEINSLQGEKIAMQQAIEHLAKERTAAKVQSEKDMAIALNSLDNVNAEIAAKNNSLTSFHENVAKTREELDTRWKDLTILANRVRVKLPEIKIPSP